ncbi:MAG: cytochrome c biogenesis protein CcsA [Cyclobacteriaceae bacterium]
MAWTRKKWWKVLTAVLLLYTVVGGFLLPVPRLPILNETIRALHFHVPMWFGMIILFGISVFHAIQFLSSGKLEQDSFSTNYAKIGTLLGILGMLTGMVWAKFTWGEMWSGDPKQNASAIGLLIYFAYFVLRGAIDDENQKAKISSVYNVFAFATLIPLLFILPRLTDSLHPGNGGNPGFNAYDLDNDLRKVFYLAIIGWTLLGVWFATLKIRIDHINEKIEDKEMAHA